MGWLVMATGLIFLFITGDILNQQTADTTATVQQKSGELWASQMLLLANRVNDVRYVSGQQNGTIP
ncbi:pilus assembly protein PilP, partial [Salmonella enterica subsp. enterica serovar Newport]